MKKVKKILGVVLLASMILGMTVVAATDQTRASKYLDSYVASIDANSRGSVVVDVEVYATRPMDEVGVSEIVIEELRGDLWTPVRSFTSKDKPSFVAKDTYCHFTSCTYTGRPGYSYRAVATVYAKDSSGSDSRITYSRPDVAA